jgi:hypothetical protein
MRHAAGWKAISAVLDGWNQQSNQPRNALSLTKKTKNFDDTLLENRKIEKILTSVSCNWLLQAGAGVVLRSPWTSFFGRKRCTQERVLVFRAGKACPLCS